MRLIKGNKHSIIKIKKIKFLRKIIRYLKNTYINLIPKLKITTFHNN